MKRLFLAGASLLLLAAGCRAIVGIEELHPAPDAAAPRPGGGDSGRSVGPGDGGGADDAGHAADSGLVAKCTADGQDCRRCCKNESEALHTFFENGGFGTQCLCDPAKTSCKTRCENAGLTCGGAPGAGGGAGGGPNDCVICTDDTLSRHTCDEGCNGDPSCLEGLACIQACPPP